MFKLYTTKTDFTSYAVDRNWKLHGEYKTRYPMNKETKKLIAEGVYVQAYNKNGEELIHDNFSGWIINIFDD